MKRLKIQAFVSPFLLFFCILLLSVSYAHAKQPVKASDYVFKNGKVYTVNPNQPWAEAVAVQDNKIVFVGSNSDVEKWTSPETRVIDLKGGMLMPGFIDGHNHLVSGAVGKRGIKLTGAADKAEILRRVAQYVKANPGRDAYLGFDWTFAMFGDKEGTRQELDAVCSDKPILLLNDDTHNAWFNTKMMEVAGLTKDTPDPIPGASFYKRERDGTPSGLAVESEAWGPMAIAAGLLGGKACLLESMEMMLPNTPKVGITAYNDMGMWSTTLADGNLGFELLLERERAGKLPCRVVGVYGIRDAKESAENHIATLKEWSTKYHSDLVQVTGLKIWADGTPATHTSVQLEPYIDKPETKGESDWTADVLTRWIETAYGAGFDVNIHAIGDGAVRRSLDAFEAVSKKLPPAGRRSVLHHIDVIHPDDLPRFKALGIGGNATLEWLVTYWDDSLKVLGKERMDKKYDIWKRLIEMGVNVSFGSDIPGTNPEEMSPLYQMQVALTGAVPNSSFSVKLPEDRVPSLEQMLYGYTIKGAYQMHMEDKVGSIETGKLADLIVLEKNLFEIPSNELRNVKVLFTMMNGKVTHQDGSL